MVAAAMKAIKQNNINYALIWVKPVFEKELELAFRKTLKVRILSHDAEELADNYFLETLVRLHRKGEGMAYDGIKPAGTPIDKKILAADKSIALGDLTPLKELVPAEMWNELKERFKTVMLLKDYDINNVTAGRKYVNAYVNFFHFAEGGDDHKAHSPC